MSENKEIKDIELNKVIGAGFDPDAKSLPNEYCPKCKAEKSVSVYLMFGKIHKECSKCDYKV